MTDQEQKEFDDYIKGLPLHLSSKREETLLRDTWIAARRNTVHVSQWPDTVRECYSQRQSLQEELGRAKAELSELLQRMRELSGDLSVAAALAKDSLTLATLSGGKR